MDRYNILVLCATEETILSEKWKHILSMVGFENSKDKEPMLYFYGLQVKNDPPYKIEDFNNNLQKHFPDKHMFDAIISENCPQTAFTKDMSNILHILKDDGVFISPNYDHRSPFYSYVIKNFDIIKNENNFTISIKK